MAIKFDGWNHLKSGGRKSPLHQRFPNESSHRDWHAGRQTDSQQETKRQKVKTRKDKATEDKHTKRHKKKNTKRRETKQKEEKTLTADQLTDKRGRTTWTSTGKPPRHRWKKCYPGSCQLVVGLVGYGFEPLVLVEGKWETTPKHHQTSGLQTTN